MAHLRESNEYTHIYYLKNDFIIAVSTQKISALKGFFSGGTSDTSQQQDQQNELLDVKFNLVGSVYMTAA